jgi:hypothetical protein
MQTKPRPPRKQLRLPGKASPRLHDKYFTKHNLTHAAGIVSAGTLGYIAGNLPGALGAATAFHRFHKKSKEDKMSEKMLK